MSESADYEASNSDWRGEHKSGDGSGTLIKFYIPKLSTAGFRRTPEMTQHHGDGAQSGGLGITGKPPRGH